MAKHDSNCIQTFNYVFIVWLVVSSTKSLWSEDYSFVDDYDQAGDQYTE